MYMYVQIQEALIDIYCSSFFFFLFFINQGTFQIKLLKMLFDFIQEILKM